jgi:hypothetical protein
LEKPVTNNGMYYFHLYFVKQLILNRHRTNECYTSLHTVRPGISVAGCYSVAMFLLQPSTENSKLNTGDVLNLPLYKMELRIPQNYPYPKIASPPEHEK